MSSRPAFAGLLVIAVLTTSGAALAQTNHHDYDYRFDPDDLIGATLSSPPPLLQMRAKGRRVLLIRPRPTFVAELVQSVERL